MRVLLIEDEIPAAERLQTLILQYDRNMEIEGPLESNEAILNWMEKHEMPDLIFSDIELLDGPVFYALERMERQVPIIFTTAYNQYALEAFDSQGISYLLKPFELEDVKRAMAKYKALQKSFQPKPNHALITELKSMLSSQPAKYKTRLPIKTARGMYLLEVAEICCIKTENGILYAHKSDGKKVPLSIPVSQLQKELDPDSFFQINRSEIIHVSFIIRIESYFNDRLALLIKGQKEPLIASAARTPGLRKWLNQL